jgi:hypothetical protein
MRVRDERLRCLCGIASASNRTVLCNRLCERSCRAGADKAAGTQAAAVLKKPAHIGPIKWASVGALFSTEPISEPTRCALGKCGVVRLSSPVGVRRARPR